MVKSAMVLVFLVPVGLLFGAFLVFYFAVGAYKVFDITPVGVGLGALVVLVLGWALRPLFRGEDSRSPPENKREP